ncbi:MAG: type III-B CRISPR module RAMP protein Cmr1 [Dictyoglomus sp.]|nr:type III-B CRISPR module RAMP protein Cmr1 [Dictyoglomus sp.]MDW8188818.1 type III-B CRISPR module RAMP protein Cmr1 [Dictyoglomus sp.]
MYTLNLKCKIITPLFMLGADGKTPELRPSEFKGMMRWWWRAIRAEDNIDNLRKEEAEIFGGTREKEGKSKIKIKITSKINNVGENIQNEISELIGLKYLYYSTFSLRDKGETIIKSFLKPDTEFELQLTSFDKKSFDIACASLWLSIYLGGFGTRGRRGGGNVEVIKAEGNQTVQFACYIKNEKELKNFLHFNIEQIKKICKSSEGTKKYTNLNRARVLIFKGENSWKSAINFLGSEYMHFRNRIKKQIFETAVFGMPVMHSRFTIRLVPYETNKRLSERYASPVIFKVIKSNNLYFPIIVALSAGGINYIGKEKRENNYWKLDEQQRFFEDPIKEFLNSLSKKEELVL